MLDSVYYLHKNGFAHRDIKANNLLLDKNFNLKLIDFGFSSSIKGKHKFLKS